MRAVVLRATGEAEVAEFQATDTMNFLQDMVGGFFECIVVRAGLNMWVNEDGINMHLPLNERASRIYSRAVVGGRIVGDVVFTGHSDSDGNITDLSTKWIESFV